MFPLSTTRCTGYIKLTDLGMAQAVPKGGTVSGKSGTRGFWPPEMIRRQPYRFEPDWWTSWFKMASTLSDDTAPSASLDCLKARAAPTHPRSAARASWKLTVASGARLGPAQG